MKSQKQKQKLGDDLYICLMQYSDYVKTSWDPNFIFENRYEYLKLESEHTSHKIKKEEYNQFQANIQGELNNEDCIGCFNFYQGKIWAFLVVDKLSKNKIHDFQAN